MSKTLFKTDSKGKVRILKLSTDGENLIQESGLETGKHTTTISKCVGKNIGRSNETTPSEQAILEMESKYKDKLTKGYFATSQGCQEGDAQDRVSVLYSTKIRWYEGIRS